MVQLKSLLLPTLSLVGAVLGSNVVDLTPDNFDSKIFAGTPALVEFFAPWCGHCKNLAPVYEELADSFASSKDVIISKVDADAHKELGSRFGVQGFPTIKYFDGKSKDPKDYSGGRDLESLQTFITGLTKAKPKKAFKAPSLVEHLTESSWKETVGKGKDVLVAFTASWCGHCKNLAPVWEKVAADYGSDADVVIAKVDAEANSALASKYGVSGYPTIKFFPKGSDEAVDYSGGRDEPSFLSYINEKAGLHRVVGGGLDAKAGTIEALDTIVSKLSGSNLSDIQKQAEKAAKDLKDKYAEYYVKVLGKIQANQGYAQKEISRLQGMLAKGGLAKPKQDDLTSRLNILKKFVTGSDDAKVEL